MNIEIPDELVDKIVKDELKKAYLLNSIPDKHDLSDDEIDVNIELLNALYTVMDYFIPEDELYAWISAKTGGLGRTEHANKTVLVPSKYVDITTGHVMVEGVPCKTHPDAPHGFNRSASHAEGRYVCDCEYWEPENEKQMGR